MKTHRLASMLRGRNLRVLFCSTLIFTGNVLAADETTTAVRIFPAVYFADAQLQTAYEMIARIPGFSFDEGDEQVRGYSGSTGNVLIDGQRPASKYGQLADLLKRMPASSVERIELIRGGSRGTDMQGQVVVANVVRRTSNAVSARVEAGLYVHGDGRRLPEAKLEGSRKANEHVLEGSLTAYQEADDDSGDGYRQRVGSSGELLRYAESDFLAGEKGVEATFGYERPLAGGELRINAALLVENKDEDEKVLQSLPDNEFSTITEDKDTRQLELGTRYGIAVGISSNLELLAIQQLRTTDKAETELSGADNEVSTEDSQSGETILRGTVRTTLSKARSLEWGVEAAFNFLDSETSSRENGISVPLPAADVRVEERRVEAFGLTSWTPNAGLNMEFGAAFEYSNIEQHGDTQSSKSLSYVKPRVLLSWTPSNSSQLRLGIERNVGQLDFDDFVSSAELSTGTVNVGNSDLEPSTSWDFIASWERQLGGAATAVVTLHHARISDVIDIVPIFADSDGDGIDEVFEGPGNIDKGTLNEIELHLNVPLEQLHIAGGLLRSSVSYRHGSVADPLTGNQRSLIDMKQPWEGEIEFTQDVPEHRFRWGMGMTLGDAESEYRIHEVRVERDRSWFELFVEYFPVPAWTVRLELQNLSGREDRLTRERYDAPRNVDVVEAVDIESHRFEPYAHLQVRWNFL